MGKITIKELEAYLNMKYVEKNEHLGEYTQQTMSQSLFMKLVEEIGEVAEALNKSVGRKLDDGKSNLSKELADVIHYTIAIAAVNEINLEEVIIKKDIEASIKYNQTPNLLEYIELNK